MFVKERFTPKIKNLPLENPTLCLNTGEGRYLFVHRLSQIKKRNSQKEMRKRFKEIKRVVLYPS
ncbi:MAG TPA: hypothetical protein VI382_05970 [Candidatus Manganitrophaceae bacterium]|nr:hypothetical protein [Candidatus Manganitrophaceae bacterium]